MRVLHLNTLLVGGAAIAAQRLHMGLCKENIESRFLYREGDTDKPGYLKWTWQRRNLFSRIRRRRLFLREEAANKKYLKNRPEGFERFSTATLSEGVRLSDIDFNADIINLHWISDMFNYNDFFSSIPQNKPIVWTLHDMNAFTGGCHYSNNCNGYINNCGNCPQLDNRSANDISNKSFSSKSYSYNKYFRDRVCIVAPSRWLAETARRSKLLMNYEIHCISNGLDINIFKPRNRLKARKLLGIPEDTQVLLFVADGLDNHRKGFDILVEALKTIASSKNIFLLTVGGGAPQQELSKNHIHLGYVDIEERMPMVYSAADLFIAPSREDNLPNTVLESISCGTPVVAFDQGGLSDLVKPGLSGYLVKELTVKAIVEAIESFLNTPATEYSLRDRCRETAIKNFSSDLQAKKYIDLYHSLL